MRGAGVTTEVALTAGSFVPYYSYAGNLAVAGSVGPMTTAGTSQSFAYSIVGADPACADGRDPSTGNSCGIHIHAGTTCADDALGHYYTGVVTADPWVTVAYTSDAEGVAIGSLTVNTGGSSLEVEGRAMIIHAYDGSRIACALLGTGVSSPVAHATAFVPYFNNPGFTVSGAVSPMTTLGTTQTFSYALSGADPLCSSGADISVSNSCGVHIHVGTSCTADALGHFYTGSVTVDPWTSIAYTSSATGEVGLAEVAVDTGGYSGDVAGRAFIVHGYDGKRIACAILTSTTELGLPPPAPPLPPPASESDSEDDGGSATVGIIVGLLFVVLVVGMIVYFKFFRKPQMPPPPPDMTPSGQVLTEIKVSA